MTLNARITEGPAVPKGVVVPAFNGQAEKFVLRAFRLFRRSLLQVNGDAGKVLTRHLRTRVPAEDVNGMLGDLTSLSLEVHFVVGPPQHLERTSAKWSSKHEFFLLALLQACQCRDKARASESAIALLDTFEVGEALAASTQFAHRLTEFGLNLMPIGDAAFNYFADYKPLDEACAAPLRYAAGADVSLLRVV
jgi:hypothetical protein